MSSTRGSPRTLLLDTSAAVALVLADHERHESTRSAAVGQELGLAGHAAFETFSVLTRLPAPTRRSASATQRLIAANFPNTRFLSVAGTARLLSSLSTHGIAGGAVYDALVGAAALEHGLPLLTLDRRARDTYRELGAEVEFLP